MAPKLMPQTFGLLTLKVPFFWFAAHMRSSNLGTVDATCQHVPGEKELLGSF